MKLKLKLSLASLRTIVFCLWWEFVFVFRLEPDQSDSKEGSKTYIASRLHPIITAVIYTVLATFTRTRVRATLHKMCPQGKLSAIGGKWRRNLVTFGRKELPISKLLQFLAAE